MYNNSIYTLASPIDHCTAVAAQVTWPKNGSEAAGGPLCFSNVKVAMSRKMM